MCVCVCVHARPRVHLCWGSGRGSAGRRAVSVTVGTSGRLSVHRLQRASQELPPERPLPHTLLSSEIYGSSLELKENNPQPVSHQPCTCLRCPSALRFHSPWSRDPEGWPPGTWQPTWRHFLITVRGTGDGTGETSPFQNGRGAQATTTSQGRAA